MGEDASGQRDALGLCYNNVTWCKDEKGKENNFIDCSFEIVDREDRVQSDFTRGTEANLKVSLCYCKEENVIAGKAEGCSKWRNSVTEYATASQREEYLCEVADQSILNIMSRGCKRTHPRSLYTRCRIEEVSKNHQANFFRIATSTDIKMKGCSVGGCISRRIYVKSKRARPAGGASATKKKKLDAVAMFSSVSSNTPPAIAKVGLDSISIGQTLPCNSFAFTRTCAARLLGTLGSMVHMLRTSTTRAIPSLEATTHA